MAFDFVSHLEELRRRLLWILFVFAAAAVLGFFWTQPLLHWAMQPLSLAGVKTLVFHKPHEAFAVTCQAAVGFAVALTFPFFLIQTWLFISPGLYVREKRLGLVLCFVLLILFFAGALFAYLAAIPFGLQFLLTFQSGSLQPLLTVEEYFSFVGSMLLIFGLLFDFPVAVYGLVRLGLVSLETLTGMRRVVMVVIFILAAVLTPSPDPVSQICLALPLLLLFELAILAAKLSRPKPLVLH